MDYLSTLTHLSETGKMPVELVETLKAFYSTYVHAAIENGHDKQSIDTLLTEFLDLVLKQSESPYAFEPYHQRIMQPIDYYHLGINFIRPLVVLKDSTVLHLDQVEKIAQQLANGENVVLFSNHQTELDPQVISLLLEDSYPKIAEEMIFVAGHRVVSDPLAIPFSKGRNLLCIYSKKYIDADPDLKNERQLHNQRTLTRMGELLSEGGKCIYVAPSGGRDRADADGNICVAPFDPQSIELFWLIAQRAARRTHFYPLALSTYHLLPPPEGINKTLGEERYTKATPVHLAFGEEIKMEEISGDDELLDKKQRRALRADFIWKQVCKNYERLI